MQNHSFRCELGKEQRVQKKNLRVVRYRLACSQMWIMDMGFFVEFGGVKPSLAK